MKSYLQIVLEFYALAMNILPTKSRRFEGEKRHFAYTCLHLTVFKPSFLLPSGLFQQFSQQLRVLPNQLLQKVYRLAASLYGLLFAAYLGEKSAVHLLGDQLAVGIETMSVGMRRLRKSQKKL